MESRSVAFQFPPLDPGIKYFLLAQLGVFLAHAVLTMLGVPFQLEQMLALSGQSFLQGHFYQLISFILVPRGLMEMLFNGLFFWFLGGELIRIWGRKAFWYFSATITIGAGIFHLLLSGLMGAMTLGLSGVGVLSAAQMLAYAVFFPDRYFAFLLIFPIRARNLMLITLGIELFMGITTPYALETWAKLWSVVLAILLLRAFFSIQQFPWRWLNFLLGPGGGRSPRPKKGHLSLVKDAPDRPTDAQNSPGRPPKYWN